MVIQKPRDWSDFEQGKPNFSSDSDQTTENAIPTNKKARSSSNPSSWMQEPSRVDKSWVPMPAPNRLPPSPSVKPKRHVRQPSADAHPHAPRPQSSSSRGRELQASYENRPRPPTSNRGRSNSRARDTREKRERSVSQTRSVGAVSVSSQASRQSKTKNKPKSSRNRPPVTRNGRDAANRGRSRSSTRDGRARTSRSRSASLTRVTNVPQQAPPSPGMRSMSSQGRAQANASAGSNPNGRLSGDEGSADGRIGQNITFQRPTNGPSSNSSVCSSTSRSKRNVMGRIFGEQSKKNGGFGDQIRSRVLLAATVYHNSATGLWITTINTNQKGVARDPKLANKYLKAFSFPTEEEARESAIANAPPKMMPFKETTQCTVCRGPFTMFKRASHCRNCGVCICKDCTVQWPSKMLPDTYNLKHETQVKVCSSCNTISSAFRRSLLRGDFQGAVALYGTGNVNLRTPFPPTDKKEEIMWPIHCAVEGGNIDIFRWLVDDHFCPITTVSSGAKKPRRGAPETLIPTSTGRNVLGMAIGKLKVDFMQYLVVDRGVSIYECSDLEASLRALEATLTALPRVEARQPAGDANQTRWDDRSYRDDMSIPSTIGIDTASVGGQSTKSAKTKGSSECIICFERRINCVATPCGHQVCCLECSTSLSSCPVCNHKGDFIKIYRP